MLALRLVSTDGSTTTTSSASASASGATGAGVETAAELVNELAGRGGIVLCLIGGMVALGVSGGGITGTVVKLLVPTYG